MDEPVSYQGKKRCDNFWTPTTSSLNQNRNSSYKDYKSWESNQELAGRQALQVQNKCSFDLFKQTHPQHFMTLMHQLELSMLCLLRKNIFTNSTEGAIFKNSKLGQFNNIIQCFDGDYYCIRTQYYDVYAKKSLSFATFFLSAGDFFLANYLNEFAMELICYLDCVSDAPKYLILYTNCDLEITPEKKLKQINTPDTDLLQLMNVNYETDPNLIQLLNSPAVSEFYRFSDSERTRNTLSYYVQFSPEVKEKIDTARLNEEEIKNIFFDRLIFAVNQSSLEELINTVRDEINGKSENLVDIRKEVLGQLIAEEETDDVRTSGKLLNTIYSYDLFNLSIHEMYHCKNITAIRFDERCGTHNIAMNVKNNFLYFKPLEVEIDKLEHNEFGKQMKFFSINNLFYFFLLELNPTVDYFVIFTNGSLTLVKELIMERTTVEESSINPLKFCRLNCLEEKYAMFRHKFMDADNLHQFSRGETRRLIFDSLVIPPEFVNCGFCHLNPNDVKEMFLDKIVFAVRQATSDGMCHLLKKDIEISRVTYDCKELTMIGLRYLMSHETGAITKSLMVTHLNDLRSKRRPLIEKRIIFEEELEFAKGVITLDAMEFGQFVKFLTNGEGKRCLATLRRNRIDSKDMSRIMQGARSQEVERVFLDLYNLWFDKNGNKTKLLRIFEGQGFCVKNMANVLPGTGSQCSTILVHLYSLWFDNFGNPTNYLRSLQMEGVNLSLVSSLLTGAKENSVQRFTSLCRLWFLENGTKTNCLLNLERCGVNLTLISSVVRTAEVFENFYNLLFLKNGMKTRYLQKLEEAGVGLKQICSVIKGRGEMVDKTFESMYELWFDLQGRKTIYLLTLENEGVNLAAILDILVETGDQVAKIFKQLYDHWFQRYGEKTEFLKSLEARGKSLAVICRLLSGAGILAVEKFTNLCHSLTADDSRRQLPKVFAPAEGIQTRNVPEASTSSTSRFHSSSQFSKSYNPSEELQSGKRPNYQETNTLNTVGSRFQASGQFSKSYNPSKELQTAKRPIYQQTSSIGDFQTFPTRPNFQKPSNNPVGSSFVSSNQLAKTNSNRYPPEAFQPPANKSKNPSLNAPRIDKPENSRSTENKIKVPNTNETFEDGDDEIYDEDGNELSQEMADQLRRNISSLMKHFPEWRNATWLSKSTLNFRPVIKQILPIINSPGELYNFLQARLIKSKINEKEFEDLNSISLYTPFQVCQLDALLQNERNLQNAYHYKKQARFAKVIFSDYSSDFNELMQFLLLKKGKRFIDSCFRSKILPQHVGRMLRGCKNTNEVIATIQKVSPLLFSPAGKSSSFVQTLKKEKIHPRIVFYILGNSGTQAAQAFKNLYQLWINDIGRKSSCLNVLLRSGVNIVNICSLFENSGTRAAESFQEFRNLCFDASYRKTKYLRRMEQEEINLQMLMAILTTAGPKAAEVGQTVYDLFFTANDEKTLRVKQLEKNGIPMRLIGKILSKRGEHTPQAFDNLYNFVFDEHGYKQHYIQTLEKEIELIDFFKIICSKETNFKRAHEVYELWFDSKGAKTKYLQVFEENGVNLQCLAGVLKETGLCSYVSFRNLFSFFFDVEFRKTENLLCMENVISLRSLLEIAGGAGKQVYNVVKNLHNLFFDEHGNKTHDVLILERNNMPLTRVAIMLQNSAGNAAFKFKNFVKKAASSKQ